MKIFDLNIKKSLTYYFILLLLSLACEREGAPGFSTVDCSECYQDKPDWGPLNATITINDQNPFVPLVIYRGNIEDNDIEYIDTATSKSYWVDVPVDRYYSISAKYLRGEETIFVIDGDELKTKYTETDCDQPCYYFKEDIWMSA
ncbi:MAG: hypothetical protein R2764_13695 [Bacteroidales bacterium]